MQDKTIDSALRHLHREALNGRHDGMEHIVALMALRGCKPSVTHPHHSNAAKPGETKRLVLAALRGGPKTTEEMAERLMTQKPELLRNRAVNRVYQALLKLEKRGLVERDGKWRLAP